MSVDSTLLVPYASYLRVYEPLAAFPEPERTHWSRYARRPGAPGAQDELRRSLADLLPVPPVPVPVHESGEAFVAHLDGAVVICPWRTRLRSWLALRDLVAESGLPGPVLDAMLPFFTEHFGPAAFLHSVSGVGSNGLRSVATASWS